MPKPIRSKLNFAAAGTNNISHLAPLLLFARAGVDVVMVPSRGEPQAISDLVAGNVDFYFGNTSVLLSRKDHPVDQAAGGRHGAAAPECAGHTDGVRNDAGLCLCFVERLPGTNGTPDDIVEKIRGAIAEMVKEPQMAQRLLGLGILPGGQTKEQVAAVFQSDRKNFADAVKAAGIPSP